MKKSNCFYEFLKYCSLNVLGMIGLSCYILADTYFVSKGLGSNGLASLNLAIPIYSFIHGSGLMLGIGGGIKYAIQKNLGDPRFSDCIFTNTLYFGALFALFFVFSGIFLSGRITRLLGADAEVFAMTCIYLQVILLFAPAFLLNNILLCFVRNDGAPQLSMAAMLGGSVSNVVLDYLFIFSLNLGIFGAAFATSLAPLISILILSPYFIQKKNHFHLVKCHVHRWLFANIFSNGISSLITEISSGIVIIIFNIIILSLKGNTGVAAYGIIANLSLVIVSIYTGIAQGIQPIISKNYGIGNSQNTRCILKYAIAAMLLLSGLTYAGIFMYADSTAAVFNSEHNRQLQAIAVQGLKLYFTACPFAGFNIIISSYFASVEHARPAHIISLLRGFLLIVPAAFILSATAGMTGIWCAVPTTEILTAITGIFLIIFF